MKILSRLTGPLAERVYPLLHEVFSSETITLQAEFEAGQITENVDLVLVSCELAQPAEVLSAYLAVLKREIPILVFLNESQELPSDADLGYSDFIEAPWAQAKIRQRLKQILKWRNERHERLVYLNEVRALKSKLDAINPYDSETGLYNRRSFFQRLEEELKRSHRHVQMVALLLIRWQGNASEDQISAAFPDLVRNLNSMRCSDFLARLGPDTLGILLPQTLEAGVEAVAENLYQSLQPAADLFELELLMGSAACAPPYLALPQQLLERAEKALKPACLLVK
ncbi:hypothetical protein COW36_01740 [bacterium (Candidatus Blackallbacteria) CG17_big_fil_post_rev_8_21_14_2_50_48_46]|uniref:GGDEF domain-containing protein n=1 Tax=bacterium (Candidatus Blackallbacteria) CG17_big_fil_post_rev_8_21_14_2_50_48_46 TaxID=2014261 RepID=A0A2M7GAH6_9BACT|nr:MAG: hypothetical protein COW64_26130 [bacterium (Candidatus Blackallbacteria) CG18_big_fil_WC_8_21_14_2_50_49_26]PIW19159.1 MAG: hypothetical protein COW36_01740 [bacterium (Candidatus Blackallbacteria) CG17_big_fil_post_rev_8_21_14_2_50_48_46]PIW45490.1 MAG: hypothetical protein COW20_20400 [bacterium (Candidatus Blackallbacteria) CG13_big_fil_rev_8_21_14_2_50_49_14]